MKSLTSGSGTKPIKECACGRTYTRAEWNGLRLVGLSRDDVERRELRNCLCKTTLSIGTPRVFVFYVVEPAPGGVLVFRRAGSNDAVMVRDGNLGALHLTERAANRTIARERRADREAAKRLAIDLVTETKGTK